jgi:2-dehydro-3-deoxyphosphogluconate aldolase / (4S)-4-hydroxy-2-oxoglutarate aldolase
MNAGPDAPATATDEVVSRLELVRVLPVVSIDDADRIEDVCRALQAGGIPCVEITFRTVAALAAIERASRLDGIVVGAGTVRTADQAEAAAGAGARFAVAPGLDEQVVAAARRLDLPFVPGAATPSEIGRALALGCTTIKLFPASVLGGPTFVQAVSAVFPEARFVPTGGIDASNLHSYLAVPAVLACGGSWLCTPDLVRRGELGEIERLAHEAATVAR